MPSTILTVVGLAFGVLAHSSLGHGQGASLCKADAAFFTNLPASYQANANTWMTPLSGLGLNDTAASNAGALDRVYGASVWLTSATAGIDALRVNGALPGGISASVSADNLTVTLTGEATQANYQAAMRMVEYQATTGSGAGCLATQMNVRFTRFLTLNQCLAGNSAQVNEIVFDDTNSNNNVTASGHAYLYNSGSSLFPARRAYANGLNIDGQSGYLTHETSSIENSQLGSCFPQNTFAGGTDNIATLQAITGPNAPTVASEIREGNWFWLDGPPSETTRPFWIGNCARLDPSQNYACGPGPAANGYANWRNGEPNDYPTANAIGQEDYIERRWSGLQWNDIFTNSGPHPSLVEFGGSVDSSGAVCSFQNNPTTSFSISLATQSGDIQVSKTNCQSTFVPGGTSTYVVEARAVGTCTNVTAQLTDNLPSNLTPVGQWSCANTAAPVTGCAAADTNNSAFYDGNSTCAGSTTGSFPLQTNVTLAPNSGVYFVYQATADQ